MAEGPPSQRREILSPLLSLKGTSTDRNNPRGNTISAWAHKYRLPWTQKQFLVVAPFQVHKSDPTKAMHKNSISESGRQTGGEGPLFSDPALRLEPWPNQQRWNENHRLSRRQPVPPAVRSCWACAGKGCQEFASCLLSVLEAAETTGGGPIQGGLRRVAGLTLPPVCNFSE